MASYCTEAQVQALLATFTISANSKPNITQADAIREMVAREIDAALSSVDVTIPVTAPAYFLSDVEYVNAIGTAAHILMAAFPSPSGPGSNAQGGALWKAYQERLDGFRKGEVPSDTTLPTGEAGYPRSFFTDNNAIGSDTAEDAWGAEIDANPAFSREKVF